MNKQKKKVLFKTVIILPAVILLLFLALLIIDINKINKIRHKDIFYATEEYLAKREGCMDLIALNNISESDINVFVLGGSSTVISDGKTFSDFLEDNLSKERMRVHNLGVSGIDSFSIKEMTYDLLNKTKPDLLILYTGHNDYTNAYQNIITKEYDSFDFLLKISYLFSDKQHDYEWFSRINRPRILKLLQETKLVSIRDEDYGSYNTPILKYFSSNIESIINATAGVPLIIITPIGNLQIEPYGDIEEVTRQYKHGKASRKYNDSIIYLSKARDDEILTASIRAKKELNEYLRNINHTDVFILDMERVLINEEFEFGNSNFLDYFHLNEKSHRLVADQLLKLINNNEDIKSKVYKKVKY